MTLSSSERTLVLRVMDHAVTRDCPPRIRVQMRLYFALAHDNLKHGLPERTWAWIRQLEEVMSEAIWTGRMDHETETEYEMWRMLFEDCFATRTARDLREFAAYERSAA